MGNQNSRDRGNSGSSSRNDPVRNSRGAPPSYDVRSAVPQLPVTTKSLSKGADARLAYGVGSMQGWRDTMEDAHAAVLRLPLPAELQTLTEKQFSFFGVYDGHGGDEVSHYLADNLHGRIARDPSFRRNDFRNAIKQGFYLTDNEMRSDPIVGNCDAGATTIVGLLTPEDVLYIGNAGDCRAVICSAGEAIALSMDHKPTLPTEMARIKRAGGVVEDDRVEGDLAVSRALGDFEYKSHPELPLNEQMVSPEPDVVERRITENDEFLILACDGIWDCISNKDAADFVRVRVAEGLDLDVVAAQLMDRCIAREPNEIGIGCDNMTVIVIAFLMGKPRKQWRETIKKRLTDAAAAASAPVASDSATSMGPPPSTTTSQSSFVDTLPRTKTGGTVGEVSMPGAIPASGAPATAAYVDTLSRSNTALSSSNLPTSAQNPTYVDTLSRAKGRSDYTAYPNQPGGSEESISTVSASSAAGSTASATTPQQQGTAATVTAAPSTPADSTGSLSRGLKSLSLKRVFK